MYVLSGLKTLGIIHSCSSLVYTVLENYKMVRTKSASGHLLEVVA